MNCYTIFNGPEDYPGKVVVRRMVIGRGVIFPTADVWLCDTLEQARRLVPDGLAYFPRDEIDPPSVVETWL